MSNDLPYKTEYSTTRTARCRDLNCNAKIYKGVLRLAEILDSPFHSGKATHWYHEECFFNTLSPSSIFEIAGFNKLTNEDQQRIQRLVERKQNGDTVSDPDMQTDDVEIDYNESPGVYCEHCSEDIVQGGVRVSLGGRAWCAGCGGAGRGGAAAARGVRGFTRLTPADQKLLLHIIQRTNRPEKRESTESETSCKKMKKEPEESEQDTSSSDQEAAMEVDNVGSEEEVKKKDIDQSTTNEDLCDGGNKIKREDTVQMVNENGQENEMVNPNEEEEKMKQQNDLFQEYRKGLDGLTNLNQILRANGQNIKKSLRKDHLADCMAFGVPERCPFPKCKGNLVCDTYYYKCNGEEEWGVCTYETREPGRTELIIPNKLQNKAPFNNYTPRVEQRLLPTPPLTKPQPLKGLQFYICMNDLDDDDMNTSQNNNDTNVPQQNSSATGDMDDSGVPQNIDDSGVTQSIDDSGVPRTINDSGVPQHMRDSSVPQNIDDSGVPQNIDDSGVPQSINDSGVPQSIDDSCVPQSIDDSGVPQSIDDSGVPQNIDDSGVALNIDDSGVPQSIDDSGVPQSIDDSGVPQNIDDSGVPQSIDNSGVPQSIDDSGVPQNIDDSVVARYIDTRAEGEARRVAAHIVALGGAVCAAPRARLAAGVWLRRQERLTAPYDDTLAFLNQMDVQVVHKSFFDLVEDVSKTVEHSIRLIREKNIAEWGFSPAERRLGRENSSTSSRQPREVKLGSVKYKAKGGVVLDPLLRLSEPAHVVTDWSGAAYSAELVRADVSTRTNAYYRMQLLRADSRRHYWVFFAWGHIGTDRGDSQLLEFETLKEAKVKFFGKFREKTKNRWKNRENFKKMPGCYFMKAPEPGCAPGAAEVSENAALPRSVQRLVKTIFDIGEMQHTLVEFEVDTKVMPLGKIPRPQLLEAYSVLAELLALVASATPDARAISLTSNRFYSKVPHSFGLRSLPPIDTKKAVEDKLDMLHQLMELQLTYTMRTEGGDSIEEWYAKLRSDIRPLPRRAPEFQLLQHYLKDGHGHTHPFSLSIHKAFVVARAGEGARFQRCGGLRRLLLWHGSRTTNFAGILSQGLRIAPAEAPATGYMFGKGIYFADVATKAAQYCKATPRQPYGLLLLCEVAVGDMQEYLDAYHVFRLPPGKHSAWGVGKNQPQPGCARTLGDGLEVPLGAPQPVDRLSTLLYNEFIVYNVAQVKVKYLLQVKFDFSPKI